MISPSMDPPLTGPTVADPTVTDQFEEDNRTDVLNSRMRSATLRAFFLSVGIHGLGLWLVIGLTPDARTPEAPLASIPLRLRIVAPAPTLEESVSQSVETELSEPSILAEIPPRIETVGEPSVPAPLPATEGVVVEWQPVELTRPSTLSLRQIVKALPEATTRPRPTFECTALQLENEMLACDNRPLSDFDALIADNSTEYKADLIDNFLNDVKSFAADPSRKEDPKLQMLRDVMYSNDSTYQQKKRAFLQR